MPSTLGFFLTIGVTFGALAAASAYAIAYHEYSQRRLRPGQSARRLALGTAVTAFVFIVGAAVVLAFVLAPPAG